ncbi:MAG: class II aldolase/adducin family protein, partial [Desulfofustis sp.]|nr:class II aldolase/adducin family protein [Desulfofustis sp.]
MGTEQNVRKGIIAACIKMNEIGINQGTSGNVSCRWKKGMLITPSG